MGTALAASFKVFWESLGNKGLSWNLGPELLKFCRLGSRTGRKGEGPTLPAGPEVPKNSPRAALVPAEPPGSLVGVVPSS